MPEPRQISHTAAQDSDERLWRFGGDTFCLTQNQSIKQLKTVEYSANRSQSLAEWRRTHPRHSHDRCPLLRARPGRAEVRFPSWSTSWPLTMT